MRPPRPPGARAAPSGPMPAWSIAILACHAAPAALKSKGGVGKAITQNHLAPRKRWLNALLQMVAPGRKNQQRFGHGVHGLVEHHGA